MSEFHVRVVEVGEVTKHPNADSLSITMIGGEGGYPVILRTGEFQPGDRAVYVPIGSVVPSSDPRWAFLGEHREIEPKKLRGVFSMGLLTKADPSWDVGRDVATDLRIVRVEPPEPTEGNEADPGLLPVYTDIAGLRAYPSLLVEGEEVIITEKIHGESARYVLGNDRLYCGSRTAWKHPDGGPSGGVPGSPLREHAWWEVARRIGLQERLAGLPGVGIFGELYGDASGMKYDAKSDARGLRLFDAMALGSRTYLDFDDFLGVAAKLDLPVAPVLYRGPWKNDLRELAEGSSTFASHVREGIVVRPARERWDATVGRVILKLHGQGFHLRKKKS